MRYLITGGTGTFGRAFLDRILKHDLADEVRIFSRDEAKQFNMMQEIKDKRVRYFIGDVRDPESLKDPIKGVDYIFHCAAMKHVWSCEQFPREALLTNVTGTENVINEAISAGVKKMILLSSDKAIYPAGIMGTTKAMAEDLIREKANISKDTILCGVRFGNLINSRGSVVEVWRGQIKRHEICTITDPEATRFIMTIEQAMDLVEYMVDFGKSGEIKVYLAPACTIRDLYMAVTDNKWAYQFTGLRPGEKMHEWLDIRLCSESAEKLTIKQIKKML